MVSTYVYILGSGRSGSTLLDWTLDCHPQVLSIGEAGRLPAMMAPEYDGRQAPFPTNCACNRDNFDCEYWGSILSEIHSSKLWQSKVASDKLIQLIVEKANSISFKEPQLILDSSSWLGPYFKLRKSHFRKQMGLPLKMIYLTRNPKAVIYSASVKGFHNYKLGFVSSTIKWTVRNLICQFLYLICAPSNRMHVSYEEFCTEPAATYSRLLAFLGLPDSEIPTDWANSEHHTFAGNRGLRFSGRTEINLDEKWRTGLSAMQKLSITLLTWPATLFVALFKMRR